MSVVIRYDPPPASARFDELVSWLTSLYGDPIGPFLARRMAKAMQKKDCIDNLRVCDVRRGREVARYEEAVNDGCCGFCDMEITHYASGRRFRYGFNFGH